jgi:1-pyrroline-5-carboxylate dehydrogenase
MNEGFKLTYATMFNPPEELHLQFEAALAKVKAGLGREYGMLIGGKDRSTAEKFQDRSPANTDIVLGIFQKGGVDEAVEALAAARKAFPSWSHTSWQDRVALLRKAADLINERIFLISAALSMEVGKNRMESLGDVAETADLIRYYCSEMERNDGYVVEMGKDPLVGYQAKNISVMRPYGTWLVISPFNFPASLTGGPAGAALVAGNTVVMKPATDTPWTVRLLAECLTTSPGRVARWGKP